MDAGDSLAKAPRPGGNPQTLHNLIQAIQERDDNDIPCARLGHRTWETLSGRDQRLWCRECPIIAPCLAYAESDTGCVGTWGGRQFGKWESPDGYVRERPQRRAPAGGAGQ